MEEYYQYTNNQVKYLCSQPMQMNQLNNFNNTSLPINQNISNMVITEDVYTKNQTMEKDINNNNNNNHYEIYGEQKKSRLDTLSKIELKLLYNRLIDTCVELLESIYKMSDGVYSNSTPCSKTERLSLKIFIENTIRRGRIAISIFITTMFYIQRLRFNIQKNPTILVNSGLALYDRSDLRKIYLVATMLAFKFLNDRNIQTAVWSKYAEYSVYELNRAECHFLRIIDYYLNITENNYNSLLDEYINKILAYTKSENYKKLKDDSMEITTNTNTNANTTTTTTEASLNEISTTTTTTPITSPPITTPTQYTAHSSYSNPTTTTHHVNNTNLIRSYSSCNYSNISPGLLNEYNFNAKCNNNNNNNNNISKKENLKQLYINSANCTPDNTMDYLLYSVINNQIVAAPTSHTQRKMNMISPPNKEAFQTFSSPIYHHPLDSRTSSSSSTSSLCYSINHSNSGMITTTTPQSVTMNISPPMSMNGYPITFCC